MPILPRIKGTIDYRLNFRHQDIFIISLLARVKELYTTFQIPLTSHFDFSAKEFESIFQILIKRHINNKEILFQYKSPNDKLTFTINIGTLSTYRDLHTQDIRNSIRISAIIQ